MSIRNPNMNLYLKSIPWILTASCSNTSCCVTHCVPQKVITATTIEPSTLPKLRKPGIITRFDVFHRQKTIHIIIQGNSCSHCCISSEREKIPGPCRKSRLSCFGTRYLIQLSGCEARKFVIYIFICMSQQICFSVILLSCSVSGVSAYIVKCECHCLLEKDAKCVSFIIGSPQEQC